MSASPPQVEDIERPTADAAASESTPLLAADGASVAVTAIKAPRLLFLDHVRGLLMCLQSIDHSRLFLSRIAIQHEEWWNMPDFEGSLYHWFVRFLTASCAPGFFLTMGMSIVLFTLSRQRMEWHWLSILKHFFIRGGVLVGFNFFMLPADIPLVTTVLFSLGVDLFLGSCCVLLEGASTKAMIARLTGTRTAIEATRLGTSISIGCYVAAAAIISPLASWYTPGKAHMDDHYNWWFRLAFLPHRPIAADRFQLYSMYAPVPWMPFVLWGIALQRMSAHFKLRPKLSGLLHAAIGTAMWIVFIPLRLHEGFGNINPGELHPSPRHSFINFFNLTKYPPSVAYTLCTLGIIHLVCALFILMETKLKDSLWTSERNPLIVFGRSAFFFYIAHFYVYRIMRWLLLQTGDITEAPGSSKGGWPSGQTGNLSDPAYWFAWVVGLVVLYQMCLKYGRFKASKSPSSIWRFF
ncbi:hypothetical protein HDU89_001842 [Geranomyces variabilis]|nr:hypothetical protein HDU89_001842 [Geranomyces variabilis]